MDYDAVSFTHQGWLSSDQKYLVFGDEFDEQYGRVDKTRKLRSKSTQSGEDSEPIERSSAPTGGSRPKWVSE